MVQDPLFHDDIYEAIRTVVMALGGTKKAGALLWPDKPVDQAGVLISNCLNRARPEKLDPEQLIFLAKQGRAVGCHALPAFINAEAGYAPPQPIEPEDERQRVQREFVQGMADMKQLLARLEKLEGMK